MSQAENIRREAALAVLAVLEQGRSLDRVAALQRLSGRNRAAVQELCYGTLRLYGLYAFLLDRLLDRPLHDAELRYLLLVGLHDLYTGRTPPYAAVNETVAAAPARARGLVNAVLRNFQRRRPALLAAAEEDAVARWNHPGWWLARLQAEYPHDWQAILDTCNSLPPMTLRVNRRRTTAQAYRQALADAGIAAVQTGPWALTLGRPLPVAELPGFGAGWVSVQDLAAQHAAPLLDCADGMRVLDACAAPGGKTAHLLELHDLDLTALDVDETRLGRVADTLGRLGLSARLCQGDAARPADWWDGQGYQRILLDAPCSASGVVRRHPDGKWLKRAGDTTALAARQGALLEVLWPLLLPGGTFIYATCSLFREENREQITAFLGRHPEARAETVALPDARDGQILPNDVHDGFFYARLFKT